MDIWSRNQSKRRVRLEKSCLSSRKQECAGEGKGTGCCIPQQIYGTGNIKEEMTASTAQREDNRLHASGVSHAQTYDQGC